jgi:hypothetical protein
MQNAIAFCMFFLSEFRSIALDRSELVQGVWSLALTQRWDPCPPLKHGVTAIITNLLIGQIALHKDLGVRLKVNLTLVAAQIHAETCNKRSALVCPRLTYACIYFTKDVVIPNPVFLTPLSRYQLSRFRRLRMRPPMKIGQRRNLSLHVMENTKALSQHLF